MADWEDELLDAVDDDDLDRIKAILARDEVRRDGDLGRKEWIGERHPPMYRAAMLGKNEMIRAMFEAGIDINSYSVDDGDDRATVLHYAVWSNKGTTAALLLELGADPALQGQWDDDYPLGTPLEWARKYEEHEEVARILEVLTGTPRKPASLNEFDRMDSVAKLKQKSQKIKELEEAYMFQSEIEAKKEEATTMEEEVLEDEERLKSKKEKLQILKKEVKSLEEQPSVFYMDEMKEQLQEIETLERDLKEVLKPEEKCPVCFLFPQQTFLCQDCYNWVCQDCKGQLATCPTCRVDLTKKELKRCKAMERVMGIASVD